MTENPRAHDVRCLCCGGDATGGVSWDEFVDQGVAELHQLIEEFGGGYDVYFPTVDPTINKIPVPQFKYGYARDLRPS